MNPKGKSIGSQITLSITVASLCSTVLSISGFYLFYYLLEVFYPRWYDAPETIMPSGLEWLWIGLTATVVVIFATLVASRLTRRIITPLNSVAESLRRVASADLDARARGGDTTMAEAATLVSDFNSMAERLSRMSENRVFWNAAIAHELRTPMTILRGTCRVLPRVCSSRAPSSSTACSPSSKDSPASSTCAWSAWPRAVTSICACSAATSACRWPRWWKQCPKHWPKAGFGDPGGTASLADCDPARIRQAVLALLENTRRHAIPAHCGFVSRWPKAIAP